MLERKTAEHCRSPFYLSHTYRNPCCNLSEDGEKENNSDEDSCKPAPQTYKYPTSVCLWFTRPWTHSDTHTRAKKPKTERVSGWKNLWLLSASKLMSQSNQECLTCVPACSAHVSAISSRLAVVAARYFFVAGPNCWNGVNERGVRQK